MQGEKKDPAMWKHTSQLTHVHYKTHNRSEMQFSAFANPRSPHNPVIFTSLNSIVFRESDRFLVLRQVLILGSRIRENSGHPQ